MSWTVLTIDQIKAKTRYACVGGPFGSDLTTRDYVDDGVPVIRGRNLPSDKRFHDADFVYVSAEKAASLNANTAAPGDVIFTQRGTLGQVGLIPAESSFGKYIISQSQMKLTVDRDLAEPEFVYWWFRQPHIVELVKGRAITSGVPHINLGILKSLEVRLPGLAEQKQIVTRLNEMEDLIENNCRRIALLEQSARLLYREWFVHLRFPGHKHVKVVDGVPKGWERLTVDDVAETVGGGTPSTAIHAYWDDGDIPWFSPTDLTRNDCLALLDSAKKISQAGLKNSSAKMLPPHTILMSSRASIGFFGIYDEPACTNQGFISLIPRDERYRYFLLHNLLSRKEEIESKAGGTTFKEINKTTFRAFPILWPHQEIVEEFAEFAGNIMNQVRLLKRLSRKLCEARDLLLPRLMNGELQLA